VNLKANFTTETQRTQRNEMITHQFCLENGSTCSDKTGSVEMRCLSVWLWLTSTRDLCNSRIFFSVFSVSLW
jgi:hypothetical protein